MQRLARFSTRYLHASAPVYAAQTKEVTIHRHGSIKNKKKTLGIVGICGFDCFAMEDVYRKSLLRALKLLQGVGFRVLVVRCWVSV